MDELFYDSIDLLKQMIATPSTSRDEANVADIIEHRLKQYGFGARRSGNNVWALPLDFDPQRPTLLLNSHIDTVKPAASWTTDPFEPIDDGERITGLGSNDAGASVVSLLATFVRLNMQPQHCNFVFLASCEEEIGGKGGIESVIPMLPPIAFAVVGEPTGMQPAVAEKGLMVLDGEVTGVAGHAARNEGVNAIYRAIPVIEALRTARFERESQFLGPVKISVTQISAGTAHNVVPDLCRFVVDVRTTAAYSNAETLALIRAMVPDATLTPRSTRLGSSSVALDHPVVRRAVTLGRVPFGSPTLSDQALIHCLSVKIGPGDSARSHTAGEYILHSEIREAIDTYTILLSGLRL